MPDHTQCPHIDRGDLRCAQRFTLANAVDVFAVCCGGQHGCAIFHRLNMEQAYGTLDEPKPVLPIGGVPFVSLLLDRLAAAGVTRVILSCGYLPDRLRAGIGTPPHLAVELLQAATGIQTVHVPYKGAPQSEGAALVGEVSFTFTQPIVINMARAGKARILGVSSSKRSALMPDVPTISEAGVPGFEVLAWYGMLAPAKTPAEIVTRLNGDIMQALKQKDVADRLQTLGFEPPAPHTPAEFLAYMRSESAKWQKVVKDANIKAE